MQVFEMVVAIVAITTIGGIIRSAMGRKKSGPGREDIERVNHLSQRIQKLEHRLENIETIVIDLEKHHKFDKAL